MSSKYTSAFRKMTGEKLPINLIQLDTSTQSRVSINEDVIQEYAEAMIDGADFPPIIVYKDTDDKYWLADGFHRVYAALLIKLPKIRCQVEYGSKRDAILFSVGSNKAHGLRRTNEDKRKAVLILLNDDEWKSLSARKIGELAGVGATLVGIIKNELGLDTSNIIGNDGRKYNLKTTARNEQSKKIRKKFYRFKMELEYKDEMKEIVKKSKLNELALLKEAFEYLQNKYK